VTAEKLTLEQAERWIERLQEISGRHAPVDLAMRLQLLTLLAECMREKVRLRKALEG
jgi:hypothetical protein